MSITRFHFVFVFGFFLLAPQVLLAQSQEPKRTLNFFSPDFYQELTRNSSRNLEVQYDIDLTRFEKVTREFGATVIDLTKLPYASPVLDSGVRAWSSWWFQKSKREFDGDSKSSILVKYDRALGLTGSPASAFTEERAHEKAQFAPWEGLCDAWTLASLFYPEPKRPAVVNGVSFSVSELKGLVLKSFEAVPDSDLNLYGEKFLGNSDAWMFPDLFPEQFHRFIEIALGRDKQAFLMDRDPGIEVWSVPVYKANFHIEANPADPSSVFVKMWLFTAGSRTWEDRETLGTDEVVFEYAYELSGDLSADHRSLTVTTGKWTKSGFVDSLANHPDYVLLPKQDHLTRASYNRFIDPEKVDQITKGSL